MLGVTVLIAAAMTKKALSLVFWLVDAKGVDVNATAVDGTCALHFAFSHDISLPCWTVVRSLRWQMATMSYLSYGKRVLDPSIMWHVCCETHAFEILSTCKIETAEQLFIGPAKPVEVKKQ